MIKGIFKLILLCAAIFYIGCGEDEITNPPPADNSTVNFNNLVISKRTIPFDSTYSGVDLYNGLIVLDGSNVKDANLIDNNVDTTSFFFRSGELSDIPVPGYQTRFVQIFLYANLTQTQFDTVKVMPDSDTSLTESDFTLDSTEHFTTPQITKPVYGFYLKGKFDLGITPNRVFGLMYVDSTWIESNIYKLRFDVKVNKAGKNSFKTQ